jgi:hypothetical protein
MAYYTDNCGQKVYYDENDRRNTGAIQHMPAPAPGQMHHWEQHRQSISIIPIPVNGQISLSQHNNSGMNYGNGEGYSQPQPQTSQSFYQPTQEQNYHEPAELPCRSSNATDLQSAVHGIAPWKVMLAGAAIMLFVSSFFGLRDENNRLQGQQQGVQQVLPYTR